MAVNFFTNDIFHEGSITSSDSKIKKVLLHSKLTCLQWFTLVAVIGLLNEFPLTQILIFAFSNLVFILYSCHMTKQRIYKRSKYLLVKVVQH